MKANQVVSEDKIPLPDLGANSTLEASSPKVLALEAAYLERIREKLEGRAGMPGSVDPKAISRGIDLSQQLDDLIAFHSTRQADKAWVKKFVLTRALISAGLQFLEIFGEGARGFQEHLKSRGPSKVLDFLETLKPGETLDVGSLALRYMNEEIKNSGRFSDVERIKATGLLLLAAIKYQEIGQINHDFLKSIKEVFGPASIRTGGHKTNLNIAVLRSKAAAFLKLVPKDLLELAESTARYIRPVGIGNSDKPTLAFDDFLLPFNGGYRWRTEVAIKAEGELRSMISGNQRTVYEAAARIIDPNSYPKSEDAASNILLPPFISPRAVISFRKALEDRALLLKRESEQGNRELSPEDASAADRYLKLVGVSKLIFHFDQDRANYTLSSGRRVDRSLSGPRWDTTAHHLVPLVLAHILQTTKKCRRLVEKMSTVSE